VWSSDPPFLFPYLSLPCQGGRGREGKGFNLTLTQTNIFNVMKFGF